MRSGKRLSMSTTTNRLRSHSKSNSVIGKNRQGSPGRFFHVRMCLFYAATVWLIGGCSFPDKDRTYYADRVEQMMGTDIRIQFYASDSTEASRVLDDAFNYLESLEHSWSHYDEESELSQLQSTAGTGEWIGVSEELAILIERGLQAWRWTEGRFDIAAGPLIQLWRISYRTDRLPTPDVLEETKRRTGSEWIRYDADGRRVKLLKEGMRLDPGGIGKGLAADLVMDLLKEHKIERALIDAGGDLLASGPPPGQEGWEVWLEVPVSLQSEGENRSVRLSLAHQAIATSGDLFQFVDIDGVRYSHIVDPLTGLGVEGHHQATVIAPEAWLADLFATVMILEGAGIENRIPPEIELDYLLLRKPDPSTDLVRLESDGWRTWLYQGSR